MSFINTVDIVGDNALIDSIIDGTIVEIADNITLAIGRDAFRDCSALTTAIFSAVTSIGEDAFNYCSELTTIKFPAATNVGSYAFSNCEKLKTADFPAATSINSNAFAYSRKLGALILRSETMATLSNKNALTATAIASRTGYIYVPRALVDSYKAATNWSTYAAQFRALEDYTVDGATTGELDPNKI